jgi:anti-anti-sigma factor
MEVHLNRLPRGAVELSPAGCLDETNLDQLRSHLLDEAPRMAQGVLLNLAAVDRVDTAAMALIMLARIEIEAHGGAFVVENARPTVRGAMDRAGLGRFVTIADRRIDSLRELRRPATAAA